MHIRPSVSLRNVQTLGLVGKHPLIATYGWYSPWLESCLPRTERRLDSRRYQGALDQIAKLGDVKHYWSVVDYVLLAVRPDFAAHARAFASGTGPSLKQLLSPQELRDLDGEIDAWICWQASLSKRGHHHEPSAGRYPPEQLQGEREGVGPFKWRPDGQSDAPDNQCTGAASSLPRFTRSLDGESLKDAELGLIWQTLPSIGEVTFDNARRSIRGPSLATALWRLPTRAELNTLVQARADCLEVFQELERGWFWSSTLCDSNLPLIWTVSLVHDPYEYRLTRNLRARVLRVRASSGVG